MNSLTRRRFDQHKPWVFAGVALIISIITPHPGFAHERDEGKGPLNRDDRQPMALTPSLPEVAPAVEPLPASCESDADCNDGLYCNGEELCAEGSCAFGEPPCPEGTDCDESVGKCFVDENTSTQCAALGDQPRGRFDRDTFQFEGFAGEEVKLVLDVGEGERDDGLARLVLRSVGHEFDADDEYKHGARGALPLELNVVLTWTGEYRVVVRQETKKNRREPGPYQGTYCLTMTSSDGAAGSMAPMSNVEQSEGSD